MYRFWWLLYSHRSYVKKITLSIIYSILTQNDNRFHGTIQAYYVPICNQNVNYVCNSLNTFIRSAKSVVDACSYSYFFLLQCNWRNLIILITFKLFYLSNAVYKIIFSDYLYNFDDGWTWFDECDGSVSKCEDIVEFCEEKETLNVSRWNNCISEFVFSLLIISFPFIVLQ